MDPLRTDLSIFQKFNFANHPVGVKFSLFKPDGFEPLDQKLAFCEILREAFKREKPFYFSKEQEDCFGRAILGMVEEDKSLGESGVVGYKWGLSQGKGTVNYVVFSPIEKLTFDFMQERQRILNEVMQEV